MLLVLFDGQDNLSVQYNLRTVPVLFLYNVCQQHRRSASFAASATPISDTRARTAAFCLSVYFAIILFPLFTVIFYSVTV